MVGRSADRSNSGVLAGNPKFRVHFFSNTARFAKIGLDAFTTAPFARVGVAAKKRRTRALRAPPAAHSRHRRKIAAVVSGRARPSTQSVEFGHAIMMVAAPEWPAPAAGVPCRFSRSGILETRPSWILWMRPLWKNAAQPRRWSRSSPKSIAESCICRRAIRRCTSTASAD